MKIDYASINLARKLRDAEQRIASEKGDFTFFALFEFDQMPGKWDLLAAAPWLNTDRAGIETLVDLIRPDMARSDWLMISSVRPLQYDLDYVQLIAREYHTEHALKEISNVILAGISIYHAYIITANPLPSADGVLPVAA